MVDTVDGEKIKQDFGLQCLITIAAYYRIPADPKNIIHLLAMEGKIFTDSDIIRGAKLLKIKARAAVIAGGKLVKMTLPAVLRTSEGYFLILKADGEKCLIVTGDNNVPHIIAMEKLISSSDLNGLFQRS